MKIILIILVGLVCGLLVVHPVYPGQFTLKVPNAKCDLKYLEELEGDLWFGFDDLLKLIGITGQFEYLSNHVNHYRNQPVTARVNLYLDSEV